MESRKILPNERRMNEVEIKNTFDNLDISKNIDKLISKLTEYELALNEVENGYYKWGLNKSKKYKDFFMWERFKNDSLNNFSKSNYYVLVEKLKKYSKILPKSELLYEEQRAKKLSIIKKINDRFQQY